MIQQTNIKNLLKALKTSIVPCTSGVSTISWAHISEYGGGCEVASTSTSNPDVSEVGTGFRRIDWWVIALWGRIVKTLYAGPLCLGVDELGLETNENIA